MWNGAEHAKLPNTKIDGIYVGEVIDNNDTQLVNSGRVKVRVFPYFKELDEEVIPWAVPAFPLWTGGGSDQGFFSVPEIGSRVYVFFSASCVTSPVYFAECPGMNDGPTGKAANTKILQTKAGHIIKLVDEAGSETIEITHKDGEKIVLTNDAVQLGKGTLKKMINEAFQSLFNAHVHVYRNYGVNGAAPGDWATGAPVDPSQPPTADPAMVTPGTPKGITSAEMTEDTKAS
jgi:type VI secretion system secreted protein VgrG